MSITAQIRPPAMPSTRQMRLLNAPSLAVSGTDGPITLSDPLDVDLIVYRGDTGVFRLTVANGDGSAHSVVDATWDADVRASADDTTVLTTMIVSPVPADPASVDVTLTAAMSALINDTAVYDVQMTQGGIVTTLVAGRVVLTKDVSRA